MRSSKIMMCCLLCAGWFDVCLGAEAASQPAVVARAEFAGKLSAAAFGGASRKSYDVLLVWEQRDPPKNEETVRKLVKGFFEKTEEGAVNPLGSRKGNAEFEAEVKRIMEEQKVRKPYRRMVRLRGSSDRMRVDEVVLREGEEVDPKRDFEQTRIYADGLLMTYTYGNRQAYIRKETQLPSHYDKAIRDWFFRPEHIRKLGVILFGSGPPRRDNEGAVASQQRIDAFVQEGYPWVKDVRPATGRDGRQTHEYEIDLSQGHGFSWCKVVCDAQDYRKVYSYEMYGVWGSERRPLERLEISRSGQSGQVISIHEGEWDLQSTAMREKDIIVVESRFDIDLPDELFKWAPPMGYLCTDARGEKPVVFEVGSRDDPGRAPR